MAGTEYQEDKVLALAIAGHNVIMVSVVQEKPIYWGNINKLQLTGKEI
jgi:hypothetical protein